MKILHVIPSYEPAWAFGGTVTATSNLCRALAKKGVDVTVYTTDADGKGGSLNVPLNQPVNLEGVKVWYFHCDLLPKNAFYSRGLAKKLKETVKNFDLVHVSAIWQWIGVDVYKYCKIFQKPYIVSAHGSFNPWPWRQKVIKKKLFWYMFSKRTIDHCETIHFTTEDERNKSKTIILQKASFIVHNGIELKKINKSDGYLRNKLCISDEVFLILFMGRIHRVKGIEFVIKALNKLIDKNFIFLIVGPQEDKSYVEYLFKLSEKLSRSKKIVWHQEVPGEKVWDFYISSNLVGLLSFDENFGYTAVEAMACGTPVLISKNVGIWKEVQVDNAGFVVNQDINEIAEVLKKCMENPILLKQFSENARKSAEKRYDINKVADLMIKAYEDVLTGRRSPELKWK